MTTLDVLRGDLAAAERVAAAREAFDAARGDRPERWAPDAAKAEWEATVREVVDTRGGMYGAVAFVARAAGLSRAAVWRTAHGQGGNRAA